MAAKKKVSKKKSKKKLAKKKTTSKKKSKSKVNKKKAKKKAKKKSKKKVKELTVKVIDDGELDYIFGRPTKYEKRFANMAYKICTLGATNKDLADLFKVSISTIHEWSIKYKHFSSAIAAGKKEVNELVRKSFLKRAIGYSHDDVHISAYMGDVIETDIVKHYPPDTEACKFWLRNREPDDWSLEPEGGNGEDPEPVSINFNVAKAVTDKVKITIGKKK